jgi:dolichyl-phosphate beta-glucosyltransferase
VTRLVLVVPCWNEGSRLKAQPFLHLVASKRDVRLLFVDAGSTDGTGATLADIVSGGGTRISLLTLPRNTGKAEAVRRGVLAALDERPELVGHWEADLSAPLSELQHFLETFDAHPEVDIVMGARIRMLGRDITRRPVRYYAGRLFAAAASIALGAPIYDTQCGAVILRASADASRVFDTPFRSRWVMDVEILARYVACGAFTSRASAWARIYELPLGVWTPGTHVRGSRPGVRSALRSLWDLAAIWRQFRRA